MLLNRTGWNNANNTIANVVSLPTNMTRQNQNWECGIHVVLTGWAYALGLNLTLTPLVKGAVYGRFLQQAMHMINLALQGCIDSKTIKAFMDCFGFIQAGQTMSPSRTFDRSLPLPTMGDYLQHNAGVRITTDLDIRRASDPSIPTLANLLESLAQFQEIPDLQMQTADTLLQTLRVFEDSLRTDSAPELQQSHTDSQGAAASSPQLSPIDPRIIEQIVLAEGAERVAADRAASIAEANAVEQVSKAADERITTERSSSVDRTPYAPSLGDDNRGENRSTASGARVPSSQQTTLHTDSFAPGGSAVPEDQKAERSPTPDGVSGTESDLDVGEFHGAAPGTTVPIASPQIEESADLVAFHGEQARRLERRTAAEARVAAARAEEEQRHRELTPPPQAEPPTGQDYGRVDGVQHPHRAGSIDDGEHPTPQLTELCDDARNRHRPGHEVQAETQGEGAVEEEVVQAKETGTLSSDHDSLFGDEPSNPLVSQTSPTGLSLPPTPSRSTFSVPGPVEDEEEQPAASLSSPRDALRERKLEEAEETAEIQAVATSRPVVNDFSRGPVLSAEAQAVLARWQVFPAANADAGDAPPATRGNEEEEDEKHEQGDGYESPS